MLDASGEKMNLTIIWFFETLATEKSAAEVKDGFEFLKIFY